MRGALARGSHSMAKHAASSDRSGHQEYILCGSLREFNGYEVRKFASQLTLRLQKPETAVRSDLSCPYRDTSASSLTL